MKKINVSIKAEVISRHLLCTAEEMAAALIRLSFSLRPPHPPFWLPF